MKQRKPHNRVRMTSASHGATGSAGGTSANVRGLTVNTAESTGIGLESPGPMRSPINPVDATQTVSNLPEGEDGEDEHPSAEQQSADETAAKAAAHDASDEEQRVEEARVKQTVAGGDPVALAPATNATETAKDVSQDDPRERAWQVRVAGCCAAVLAGVSPFSRVPRILSLSLSVCVRM